MLVNDQTICLYESDEIIEFFDLQSFRSRYHYQYHPSDVSVTEVNSIFYVLTHHLRDLYTYDKYGLPMHEINLARFEVIAMYGYLHLFDGNLYLNLFDEEILKFKTLKTYKSLKNIEYQVKKFPFKWISSSVLSNNQVLILTTNSLKLYDENLTFINSVINGPIFDIDEITCNEKNEIFAITDNFFLSVIDTNFKETKIEEIRKILNCISHKNGYLYVTNNEIADIEVYDENLKFIKSYKLKYLPMRIRVTHNVIAVSSYDHVYFYDLLTFKLRYRYEYVNCKIFEIDSKFYILLTKKNQIKYIVMIQMVFLVMLLQLMNGKLVLKWLFI